MWDLSMRSTFLRTWAEFQKETFPGRSQLAGSVQPGLSHNQFHATSCSESHSFGTRERKDDSITALDG